MMSPASPGHVLPVEPAPLRPARATSTRLREDEVEFTAIRAQGAGGQHVNKVSTAVHARLVIATSSLPEDVKERLLALPDQRVSKDGVLIVKAQQFRSQEMNRADALARLQALVDRAARVPTVRRATRPTRASQRRRLEGKSQRGQTKALRGKVRSEG